MAIFLFLAWPGVRVRVRVRGRVRGMVRGRHAGPRGDRDELLRDDAARGEHLQRAEAAEREARPDPGAKAVAEGHESEGVLYRSRDRAEGTRLVRVRVRVRVRGRVGVSFRVWVRARVRVRA